MKFTTKILHMSLQLFADGGNGAGTSGVQAGAADPQTTGKDALENVQYGIQENTAAQQQKNPDPEPSAPDRNAEFEKLIKGEYKDLYDARVQETVKGRLKNTKSQLDRYQATLPLIQELAARYGIRADKDGSVDIEALTKAIDEDSSYFEAEAVEKGKTVDEIREAHKRDRMFRKLEAENKTLKEQMEQTRAKENADRIYAGWMQQAENLKQVYTDFDLQTEMRNPAFVRLLQANVDMKTAYQVIHQDEIMRGGMEYAVQQTAKQMTNKIIANGNRPHENGSGAAAAAITKTDVSQLSNQDFDEIRRRVMRGERISFG